MSAATSVRALDITENQHASALTAANLAGVDVVIDFTAPEAAVENMRAVLALGSPHRGRHHRLVRAPRRDEVPGAKARRRAALRNQLLHGRAKALPAHRRPGKTGRLQLLHRRNPPRLQARRPLRHRHHAQADHRSCASRAAKVQITSHRVGDAKGEHMVTASSEVDTLEIRHDAHSAAAASPWARSAPPSGSAGKSGAWDFREICDQL